MEIKREFSKKIIFIVGVILLLVVLAPSYYFYKKYQQLKRSVVNPNLPSKTEIQKLLEKVDKLIVLPKDEEPTIYTEIDVDKIKKQPFFTLAKNGDRVLIYSKARKAILYDPKANKVVEVGPLAIPTILATVSPLPAPPSEVLTPDSSPTTVVISPTIVNNQKIVIYNGTKTFGLANDAKEKISQELPELIILATGNAKGDYKENIIVDLKNNNAAIVNKLQTLFSAKIINSLPEGEDDAGADVVILLGK